MSARHKKVRVEFSAGGIVYRKSSRGIEIGFIKDPYHKWTFPKGHIKEGEDVIGAAVRETEEEMGLKGLEPIMRISALDIWFVDRYVHKGDLIHKFIYLVLIKAPANAKGKPEYKEKICAIQWVPIDQALSFSGYANIRPVLKKAIEILKKRNGK